MKAVHVRIRLTWLLLAALLLPILAACGEAPGAATVPSAPAVASTAASAAASTAPAGGAAESTAASTAASAAPSTAGTDASTAASAAAPPAAGSEDTSKFLVYGNAGEPDSLDSMDTTSGQALVVTDQIEEPLVSRVSGQVSTAPGLATEWSANSDSSEWTFKLRQGVKFHDGTDFNADAVVFNFRRMLDPTFEFAFRDQGKTYAAVNSLLGAPIGDPDSSVASIDKIDEFTVKFTLTRPFTLFPELLSSSYFGISSPQAVQQAGAKYGTPGGGPVGTGPFKFESWTPGQNIVLVRNDDYWGEKAKMPGAVVRFIADAPARLAELQAGSIDFAQQLSPDARATLESDANLVEPKADPFNTAYIALNLNNKPFDDVRVRQAVAYAINKQEILDAFYGGVGTVATDFLPDGLAWARPDSVEAYNYDPERAKQLLAEAGYPNGFDTMVLSDGTETALEFWYMPVSRPYFATPQPIAEAIATQLADVGIKVTLKTEDWGVYLDNVDQGKKNGMWMLGWTGDYPDPNNFLYTFFGPSAADQQGYQNAELIKTLQDAGAASNRDQAAQLFKQAAQLISKDVPRIPIVHSPPVAGGKATLQGWKPSPFGHEPWNTLFIEK